MKLWTFLGVLLSIGAVKCIQPYYMDLNCGKFLDFSNTGIYQIRLRFTSHSTYKSNTNCVLYLKTDPSERFMFYFKSIQTTSCTHAWLDVFDSNTTTTPVPGVGRKCGYKTSTSSVYTTRRNVMTLNFFSDAYMLVDKGFDMVITSYHTGSCYSYEHECDNGRCIYDSLQCNGYNPCGDHSDCPLTGGAIAGIVIGCFIFVVIVTTLLVVCNRRRRRRYNKTIVTETTSYGSATYGYNQPPPPAYPTGQQYPPPTGQQYPQPTGQPYPQPNAPLQYPQN